MRELNITAQLPGRNPDDVYASLCDFESYPRLSKEVRSVSVTVGPDGVTNSRWEIDFRGGALRWAEEDFFEPEARSIIFRQTEGDIEHFSGRWRVAEDGGGSRILFDAQFDMGLPTLKHILDPIAEQALRGNITAIIKGLFGDEVTFLSDAPAGH
ncbi:MAG TPA: SRPBCC family protein [Pyrinomonadaceae bacterium]|jgi:ribosome-associated toxin RatA of RatAB toxin-antitoxin module|nr:SRPBCC family protein [Pyrinomonadaceae bacterium]